MAIAGAVGILLDSAILAVLVPARRGSGRGACIEAVVSPTHCQPG
jgi:hypothetical protein